MKTAIMPDQNEGNAMDRCHGTEMPSATEKSCCHAKPEPVAPPREEHGCCGGHGKPDGGDDDHHHRADVKPSAAAKYFCPMCPGVESDEPSDCPKCRMALERNPAY